jgi:hypothetical protein
MSVLVVSSLDAILDCYEEYFSSDSTQVYQVIISGFEYDLQTATHQLQIITNSYSLDILTEEIKVVASHGKRPAR